MAKKKVNKVVVAALIAATLGVGGVGVAYSVYRYRVRPAQNYAEGLHLMKEGKWEEAYEKLGRASGRYVTDMDFQRALYETINHRTSFDDDRFRAAISRLEQMLTIRPSDEPTLVERLRLDADSFEVNRQLLSDLDTIHDRADRVLKQDPNNEVATRAMLFSRVLSLSQQGTPTTADIQAVENDLKALADEDPKNPDKLAYYAVVTTQRRAAMIRDQAIQDGPDTDVAKAIFNDLDGRVSTILAAAADDAQPALPAEQRARIYWVASQVDRILISSKLVARDHAEAIGKRLTDSSVAAARVCPPTSPLYVNISNLAAETLEYLNRFDEAERQMRTAVDARPELWSPRLELAEYYGRRNRPGDALAVLAVDLKPNEALMGLQGHDFFVDSQQDVPIRRAYFRLAALAAASRRGGDPTTRPNPAGEIAKAQSDYDLAVAQKVNPDDPRALQALSALQEARGDFSTAAETLRRAVDLGSLADGNGRTMLRHLVDLNLRINQPGRAADLLQRLLEPGYASFEDVFRLLDLRIRNNQIDQATAIIAGLRQRTPDNPIVALAEAKVAQTAEARNAALDRVPEDNDQLVAAKFAVAADARDQQKAREIAQRGLAAHPDNLALMAQYVDLLVAANQKDEAVRVVDAAIAAKPDVAALKTIRDSITAATADQRADVVSRSITDPYQRKLFDAQQLLIAHNTDGYVNAMREAMALDANNDGVAIERLFLFFLSQARVDEAAALIEPMSKTRIDPAVVRAHRGRLAIARGNADEALAIGNALTHDLPTFAPGWIVKGEAHQIKGQWDLAANAFDSALQVRPEDAEALRNAIDVAEQLHQPDRMRRFIDAALRASNNDPYFVDKSLRYELLYGDPTKTIQPRLAARDANPDDPTKWLALAQSYAASYSKKRDAGDTAAATDFRKKAVDVLTQATAKFPDTAGFPLQAAQLASEGGDAAGAIQLVDAMEQNPKFRDDPQVAFVRAEFYVAHGQADRGRQMMEGVVNSGKGSELARLRLAALEAAAGQVDQAIQTLDAAPQKTPSVNEAKFNVLVQANRVDDAVRMANDELARDRSVPNLLMAAYATAAKRDIAGALNLCNEALNKAPDDGAAHLMRARVALNENPVRNADVIADLEAVRKSNPNDVEARLMLADRYGAVGRPADALSELEALQKTQPANLTVARRLIDSYTAERPPRFARAYGVLDEAKKAGLSGDAQVLELEGDVALQAGDSDRAIQAFAQASRSQPNNLEVYRKFLTALVKANKYNDVLTELDRIQQQNSAIYWTYMIRGIALHQLHRDAEAAQQFERALSIATSLRDHAPPLTELASTYASQYGAEAAAEWLKQKLPGNPESLALAISLYTREAKFAKAVEAGRQLLPNVEQLDPGRQVASLRDLGTAALAVEPPVPQLARDAFERILKITPNDVLMLNNLAYTLTLDGSGGTMQQAAEVAKKAYDLSVQSGTNDPYVMDTYGWTLIQAGDNAGGVDILKRAEAIKRLPEIEYHLGFALIVQGDKAAALQTLQNALALIQDLKKNNQAFDASLEPKIQDAIRRAQELPDR